MTGRRASGVPDSNTAPAGAPGGMEERGAAAAVGAAAAGPAGAVLITRGASWMALMLAAALRAREPSRRVVLFSARPPLAALPRGVAWAQGATWGPDTP